MSSKIHMKTKYIIKEILLHTPLYRWISNSMYQSGHKPWHHNQKYWDEQLAGNLSSYLDGLHICIGSEVIGAIIHHFFPRARSILDLGCASGMLATAVMRRGFSHYTGVDISSVAIAKAKEEIAPEWNGKVQFFTSDIASFKPAADSKFDCIAFNEILYYLEIDEALEIVNRFTQYLSAGGCLCISLKNDPKSHVISNELYKLFPLTYGFLYQSQLDAPRFRIKFDNPNPAFQVSLFRPASNCSKRTSLTFNRDVVGKSTPVNIVEKQH